MDASAADIHGLLTNVQSAAVDGSQSIASVLRNCAVLAARLKNEDFKKWVSHELNGYPADELPPYRILPAQAFGNLLGVGWAQRNNVPIPSAILPEKNRDFGERVFMRQPIATIDELSKSKTADGTVQAQWPGNLILMVQGKFTNGWQLTAAWQEVPTSMLTGLVDTVRNRILEFTLQLEGELPNSGMAVTPTLPAKVEYLYQTIINGNVTGNVATGSPGAVQTTTVTHGNLDELVVALKALGVPSKDADDLVPLLKEEATQPMGPKTTGWITSISTKVSKGTVKLMENATTAAIVKLVMSYFGL